MAVMVKLISNKIYFCKRFYRTKKNAKSLLYLLKYREENIPNHLPTVMFPGTPCGLT